ncbi:MAG: hypothetical protein RBR14_04055 [Candidatus Cloacimonas acidaminovorans]|nr:hypothetical protein [Candidatus Cloacimonas acidaminovorans]
MEIPNRMLIIRKVTLLNVSRTEPPTMIWVRDAINTKLISRPIINAMESHNLLEVKIIHLYVKLNLLYFHHSNYYYKHLPKLQEKIVKAKSRKNSNTFFPYRLAIRI